ncbi:hypothetical protein FRC01_013292, partial [Tulasnella sp. 417]
VGDSSTAAGSSASWFKIWQNGLVTADATTQTYTWATDVMNSNCGKVSFTMPSDIASGDYLLRAEVIALHVAGGSGGSQHYMSCFQLTVTGGGNAGPPGVSFPGAYSLTDPGILFNMYTSFTTYTIPGPTVYKSGGPAATTTTTTKTSSTSKTSSTTASGPLQTLYGQCGGTGWTGATACAQGTCTYVNAYYSQ